MRIIAGDLIALALNGHFDVIVHGCNCHNTMGSGIAASIRRAFPEAHLADSKTKAGSRTKLGTFSAAEVERAGRRFTVVNAYTQFDYGRPGVNVDYDAVARAFADIAHAFPRSRIGYPMIGAGLGGGDWELISKIINGELLGFDHTLVVYKP